MPALAIYTDPLKPGIAQVPVFAMGDSTSWTMTFNNGSANYDPGSVSVVLGNIGGLEDINYSSAFRFIDRLNYQSVATSFTITSGVPGDITWDDAPFYLEGGRGAYMIRGRRPPAGSLKKLYIIDGRSAATGDDVITYIGGVATVVNATGGTLTDQSQMLIRYTVTNPGSLYTTQPNVAITGGGGSGATAVAIINGQGLVTAVIATAFGTGYSGTPTVTIDAPGGGGTTATATAVKGVAQTITAFGANDASGFTGQGSLTSLPALTIANGTTPLASVNGIIEGSGIEFNEVCFVRDPITQEVLTGVQCIPIWNGRLNSEGNEVYDDALLVIRPRIILEPTFNASGSGASTVYSGTMNPVTDWVKAVLRYRRSCTMDLQVFGAGRLLFLGKLTVVNDAQ